MWGLTPGPPPEPKADAQPAEPPRRPFMLCLLSLQETSSYFPFLSRQTLLNVYLISTRIFVQINRTLILFGAAMCPVKASCPWRHFVIAAPTGRRRLSWMDPGTEGPQSKAWPPSCTAWTGLAIQPQREKPGYHLLNSARIFFFF